MTLPLAVSALLLTLSPTLGAQTLVSGGSTSSGAGIQSPYKHDFGGQTPWYSATLGTNAYVILKKPSTWLKAELYAQLTFNVHLVVVNTAQEHFFLYTSFCGTLADSRDLWIGLTDKLNEGAFQWVTGEPITYTKWGPVEPNNYSGFSPEGEDFGQFMGPGGYVPSTWNDMSPFDTIYDQPIHGVIEFTPGPLSVPNPISVTEGGMHVLPIVAPPQCAGMNYHVLGSVSGTTPGIRLDDFLLPLNPDAYTAWTLANANSPLLRGSAGQLDSEAEGMAALILPAGLPSDLIGLQVSHCAVVYANDQIELVTVPLTTTLVP